jgi:cytochrome c oxidase subunit 4
MKKETSEIGTVSYRAYLLVWASLVMLTGITIYVAGIDMGRFGVTANILIASLKAGLVVQIFMHLRNESRFLKIMLLMALLSLTVIIVLTFLDILYR